METCGAEEPYEGKPHVRICGGSGRVIADPTRTECHVPPEVRYQTRHEQCLEMLDLWGAQVPHGWVTGDDELGVNLQI